MHMPRNVTPIIICIVPGTVVERARNTVLCLSSLKHESLLCAILVGKCPFD